MNHWNLQAKRLLKAELTRRGVSTSDLASMLAKLGIEETKSSIDSKISRGTFSATFLLQCLEAIGCRHIEIYTSIPFSSVGLAAESSLKYQVSYEK